MNVQEIDISSVIKEMLESNEKYWKISNEINGFTEFKDSFASNEKEIYDCYDYIIKTVKMIKVKNLVSSITEEMLEDSNNTEGIDKKKIEVKVMNGFKDIIPNKNDRDLFKTFKKLEDFNNLDKKGFTGFNQSDVKEIYHCYYTITNKVKMRKHDKLSNGPWSTSQLLNCVKTIKKAKEKEEAKKVENKEEKAALIEKNLERPSANALEVLATNLPVKVEGLVRLYPIHDNNKNKDDITLSL